MRRETRTAWLVVSGVFTVTCIAIAASFYPGQRTIEEIERTVRLPQSARPVGEYARYYTARPLKGELVATYLLGPREKPGIHRRLRRVYPPFVDGGCAAVGVVYDMHSEKIVAVFCSGLA